MPRMLIAIALVVAALGFAACGDDDEESSDGGAATTQEATTTEATTTEESSGGGAATTLALAAPADGGLSFDKTELTAKAGEVKIDFDNPSSVPHAVEIEGNGVEEETETVTKAKTSVTVDLQPGTYEYYCPVGNHRGAGMEGTLTVE